MPNDFENNGGTNQPLLAQQRQRRRLFQTGLFICFMLLLLDNKNDDEARLHDLKQNNTKPENMDPNLKSIAKNQPLLKNTAFPTNVSGLYSGLWVTSNSENVSALTSFDLPEEYFAEKSGLNPLQEKQGIVFLQLYSSYMTGSREVSLIRGTFRAFNGMHTTSRKSIAKAIIFNFQGIHFVKGGKVTAVGNLKKEDRVSMIFKNQQLKRPDKDSGNEVSISDTTDSANTGEKNNDGKSSKIENADRRKLQVLEEQSGWVRNDKNDEIIQNELAWINEIQNVSGLKYESSYSQSHNQWELTPLIWNAFGIQMPSIWGQEQFDVFHTPPDFSTSKGAFSEAFYDRSNGLWPMKASRKLTNDVNSFETESLNVTEAAAQYDTRKAKAKKLDPGSVAVTYTADPNRWKVNQQNSNLKDCVFLLEFEVGPKGNKQNPLKSKWAGFLNGTIYSPNCDVALKIGSQAMRVDWESAYKKAVNYSVMMTLVCLLQLGLLFKQLHFSQNQAAAAKVSMLCIGQQAILDALLCLLHLLLCATWQPLFAAFASISFFKLVTFCIFEMRYLILIFQSRQPQSFFADGMANLRREMATLHGRFYVALFGAIILAYSLQNHFNLFLLIMYSYWVPQIICNVRRNTSEPFHPAYLVCMALTRLALPLYFFGCPKNFLKLINPNMDTAYASCALLFLWTALQMAVLFLQDKYGAQFFIPQRFLPPKYNYHRPLPEVLRGESAPLNSAEGAEMDVESGNLMECAICQVAVDISTEEYMLTPCDHIFHEECLSQWMNIKMECPTCRSQLPPP